MIDQPPSDLSTTQRPLVAATAMTRKVAGTVLLNDVSLVIDPGDRIGLVGPSGCGKSSLLRGVAMLDRLDGGTITHNGDGVSGQRVPCYRRRVAYLPQRPTMITGSVGDNLRLPFQFGGREGLFDTQMLGRWLSEFGKTEDFLSKDASRLSGGEQQSVTLIRVLLTDPSVLLLDEPTASMDAVCAGNTERLLHRWLDAEPRRAWVWTSHDAAQIQRVASRLVRMERGGVIVGE